MKLTNTSSPSFKIISDKHEDTKLIPSVALFVKIIFSDEGAVNKFTYC